MIDMLIKVEYKGEIRTFRDYDTRAKFNEHKKKVGKTKNGFKVISVENIGSQSIAKQLINK